MAALQRKQISADNARMRLEDLCARSEHCEYELREMLWKGGVSERDAETILSGLRKARFYDDSRFAYAYVCDKLRYSRWGRRKIVLGLMAKRIARDVADEVLDEIDMDEYMEIAVSLARAKARMVKEGNTFEGRTKLYRFLLARGFESSVVSRVMKMEEKIWGE